MLNTYRKWKDNQEVFFIKNSDWNDYYCEESYIPDSYRFDKDYILNNSIPASQKDISYYKSEYLLYNN